MYWLGDALNTNMNGVGSIEVKSIGPSNQYPIGDGRMHV